MTTETTKSNKLIESIEDIENSDMDEGSKRFWTYFFVHGTVPTGMKAIEDIKSGKVQ